MNVSQLILIAPEIFLALLALAILVLEPLFPNARKSWMVVTIGGLVGCALFYLPLFTQHKLPFALPLGVEALPTQGGWVQYPPLLNMIAVDSLAVFFKLVLLFSVILVMWISMDYFEFTQANMGLYSALILLGTVGMMIFVGSIDLLMAIISMELLSVSSFVLTGFAFRRVSSSEAAIKYFLVGTFSTALFLFGSSYYYGYFGTTSITPLLALSLSGQGGDVILGFLIVFLIAGLGFKLAMVPFHMWAPDAYEGAPTPITAFLSVAPKAAAIGFFIRIFINHAGLRMTPVLAILAALTMTVGNIGALHQTSVKRLLAYSSIAQVGYILVAIVAGGRLGTEAAMVYTFFYVFMNLGVFAILVMISNQSRSDDIVIFAGLSKRSFGLSLVLVAFLLSLSGIPPLAGFVGKFAIFASVIKQPGLLWLGIVAVINSVVSLYYYFRIAKEVFFHDLSEGESALCWSPPLISCIVVSLIVTFVAGILPNPILGWVRSVMGS